VNKYYHKYLTVFGVRSIYLVPVHQANTEGQILNNTVFSRCQIWRPRFSPLSVHVGLGVDKVVLGQVACISLPLLVP